MPTRVLASADAPSTEGGRPDVSESSRGVERYAIDGVVIVLGVLIALAADAAWDYRVDRADERVALRQLDAEFRANASQLDSVATGHRLGLDAAAILLDAVRGETALSADSMRNLVRALDVAWTFNPKLAALESVTQSGRLGLIRDDSLRVELVGWPGTVDDLKEDELFAADYAYSTQFDAFSSALNWGDIYGPGHEQASRPMHIVGNDTLESVLAYRYSWFEAVLIELALVEAALSRVRALLDANLSTG
jgi:hypothetical protein